MTMDLGRNPLPPSFSLIPTPTLHESNLCKFGNPLDDGLVRRSQPESKIMPQKLLDVLMLGRCSHEFSWPRRAVDGHYYQVCLLCAAEFKYDWNTMQRVERLEHVTPEVTTATGRRTRSVDKKPTWVPRPRRLKLDTPMLS